MFVLLLLTLTCGSLFSQTVRPIPWKSSSLQASAAVSGAASAKAAQAGADRKAYFAPGDIVFPHLATGDGWETEITLVNLGTASVDFDLYFYAPQGGELNVTLREQPSGDAITNSAFSVTLGGAASTTMILLDATPGELHTGWAMLDYLADGLSRIGGHATFRQKIDGRPDFEALIPMSSYSDYTFLLPVNDTSGFITALAICNPSMNLTANILLQMRGEDGLEIDRTTISLPPQGQRSLSLREEFPDIAGRFGTLFVESSTDLLSAIGLRFNTAGGHSFSSVPIMNWEGLHRSTGGGDPPEPEPPEPYYY